MPYLFGSVLTATRTDVVTIVALGACDRRHASRSPGRALFAIVLDEESARVSGLPVETLNTLLAALTAVTIVAAMRVVGVLLVAALMVLPVATSRLVARSFRATVVGAVVVGHGVGGARPGRARASGRSRPAVRSCSRSPPLFMVDRDRRRLPRRTRGRPPHRLTRLRTTCRRRERTTFGRYAHGG